MNIKNYKVAVALAIFCTLLWGTAFPFIKLGYSEFGISENDLGTKLLFAGARFTLAGIMVLSVSLIAGKKLPTLSKNSVMPVIALGLVQTAGQYIFTYIGIGFTSSTNTSLITACASFFTVLFAPLFFRQDRLNFAKIAGCVIGFLGVLAVNSGGGVSVDTLLGDFLILMSTVSATAGNFISKGIVKGRNPLTVTAYQLVTGGAVLTICGLVSGGKIEFKNLTCVLILFWLSFVSAAAFAVWTALLKYHDASRICVFNLLVPVFGTVLSGIMLGEDVFGVQTFVSLALICAGIFFVNKSGVKTVDKRKIKGVISDMDGVILDSEKLYVRFWCEAARFYGYPMEKKHALAIRSMARPLAVEKLKSFFGVDFNYKAVHSKRVELMDKYIEENGIELKSGAKELLEYLKENGYKVALATATAFERTEKYLRRLELFDYFDEIVCASMVERGKPAPDIYLEAAKRLGIRSENCIALEDSFNGIKSASSAGCVTVMVPDLDLPDTNILPLIYDTAEGLCDVKRILEKLNRGDD